MSKDRLRPGDWAILVRNPYYELRLGELIEITKDDQSNVPYCGHMVLHDGRHNKTGYWFEAEDLEHLYSPEEVQREQATKPPQAPVPHTESGVPKP